MIYNYLKIAVRIIKRNRISSFVNIAGLGLGICAFLFLMEYISLERNANTFHKNVANMYRLINENPAGETWPEVEPGWAPLIKEHFPEVADFCRFDEETGNTVVSKDDIPGEAYSEQKTGFADGNFFTFFTFPLLSGQAASLNHPNVVFISQATAHKYFGKINALNHKLVLNNQFGKTDYIVGGVYADMKDNSDLQYNMLFSLETLKNPANLNGNDWAAPDNLSSQYINTYFSLNKDVNIHELEKKLTALRTTLKNHKDGVRFRLQPFAEVHLGSSFHDTFPTYGNLTYVYMLAGIALLILLIAWFNYINLSTANSFKRAGEVGVRKVIGASRAGLVVQFLSESFMINILGFALAVVLVTLLQPFFNDLVDKHLALQSISDSGAWLEVVALLSAGSLISGSYTAFTLSGFRPVETLKGKISKSAKGIFLRKSLVVSQFAISILLIITTLVIISQVRYMQNKKLGLNPSQLLVIRGPQAGQDSTLIQRETTFQNQLADESFVQDFCSSGSIPGGHYNFTNSGFTIPSSKKGDEFKSYSFAIIDSRFLSTYQIPLVAGRNFTAAECNVAWNNNSKVLMNETAVKELGFEQPQEALTTRVQWHERKLEVIGVVKDYNHLGVQNAIGPMIFYPQNNPAYFSVRLSPGKTEQKIGSLEKTYKSSFPGNPFEYFFADENYNKLYSSEIQYGHIFTAASLWAILIACLGLFGLVTFTVESRIKEIGVRKVLGASVTNIVSLLSKEFMMLVLVAFVIAAPVAWFLMNRWLENFAYRIQVGWVAFAMGGTMALFVAVMTVSLQALKAANANPVKSLKTE